MRNQCIMKFKTLICFGIIASFFLVSCGNNEQVNDKNDEVTEGRLTTHMRHHHFVHQEITPEEREMAKEHITHETAPFVSVSSIDSVGAKMINESRKH